MILTDYQFSLLILTDVSFLTFSNFHFVHDFVTLLMDTAILFYRILPWFWKVSNTNKNSVCGNLEISLMLFSHYIASFVLQKSGDFVVLAGLNAENEIRHTLSFLAGVMIWEQVQT